MELIMQLNNLDPNTFRFGQKVLELAECEEYRQVLQEEISLVQKIESMLPH